MSNDYKRLYRSQTDGRLAGVCAGLGDYLKIDPVVLRLVWVGVTCLTGIVPGVLAYLIGWIVVPPQPVAARTAPSTEKAPQGTA